MKKLLSLLLPLIMVGCKDKPVYTQPIVVHMLNNSILDSNIRIQHCDGVDCPGAPDSIRRYNVTYVYDEVIDDPFPSDTAGVNGSTPSLKSHGVWSAAFRDPPSDSSRDDSAAFQRVINEIKEKNDSAAFARPPSLYTPPQEIETLDERNLTVPEVIHDTIYLPKP